MKRANRSWTLVVLAAMVLGLSGVAAADDDPPGRIARLSYMSGDVSMQPAGVDEWVKASVNRPLTRSDRLWTASRARAELRIGSTAIRMAGETSLTFSNLDDSTVQLQLAQGTLELNVRQIYENETYEVDTPNGSFTVARAGEYRFDVDSDGDVSTAMVRSGQLEAWQGGQSVTLGAGRLGTFRGANFAYDIGSAPGADEFDRWCAERDRREDNSVAARYVSPYMTGYDALDGYGSWSTVDTYGPMWVPVVSAGWVPYRYGHWVWISPWGWTWIDDSPWGFAPFHYGRWVYYRNRWGWCPGPRILRPVYAPALVAWIGGRSWGIGVGFGWSSWVPLGWGEVYAPWYRSSSRYWHNVNRTTVINNTTIINNYYNYYNGRGDNRHVTFRYANYNVRGAVTAAPHDALLRSQRIDRVAMKVPDRDLGQPDPVMAPRLTPGRETRMGGRPPVNVRPPERVLERPVVARNPVPPAKFADKDARVGRPLDPTAERLRPGFAAGQPGNAANRPEQQARTAPVDKTSRRWVPRPPEADRNDAANDFRRTPLPADNGIVRQEPRREVPRPPDAERASERGPNNEGPRAPRAMDDGQARPVTRHEVPRPQETGGVADNGPNRTFPQREVPRPEVNGSSGNNDRPRYGSAPQPRYESPRYEQPRTQPAPQWSRRDDAPRATPQQAPPRQQMESRPAPPQRQAAPQPKAAPEKPGPMARGDADERGRKP